MCSTTPGGLERLNQMSKRDAIEALMSCCHCRRWAESVYDLMPFGSEAEARRALDASWEILDEEHYLEAIANHPRIGDSASAGDRERSEQSGALSAPIDTRAALAAWNREYSAKFGFNFLICAAGRTGDELLASLRQRYRSDRPSEIATAVEEQRKITHIRFSSLIESSRCAL